MPTSKRKALESEARCLRYCGYLAQADYQKGRVVLKSKVTAEELEKIQPFITSPIHVPPEYLKEATDDD